MGLPLTGCLILRAARNEDEGSSRARLKEVMEYNRKFGSFTFVGCKHDPRCQATEEQLMDLFRADPAVFKLLDSIENSTHEPSKAKAPKKARKP